MLAVIARPVDGGKGFFIEPTIFGGVTNEMKIAQEEIFGPVLAALTFDDVEQVIVELAQHTVWAWRQPFGPRDIKKAHQVSRTSAEPAPCGSIPTDLWTPRLPFGGYKQSSASAANWAGMRLSTTRK